MKRILATVLALLMFTSLIPVSAVSDADNELIRVFGPANKAQAFAEFYGDKTKYGFDINGYADLGNGAQLVGSTYDGYGYHTFINVNGAGGAMQGMLDSETELAFDLADAISAMSYDCAISPVQNIGGLNLKVENSFEANGNTVRISYTVNNPSMEEKVFSLATTADLQLGDEENSEIRKLTGSVGATLNSADGSCIFSFDSADGGADSLWIGEWAENYFLNMFNNSPDGTVFEDGDGAICWSWTNRTIAAGETLSFYMLVGFSVDAIPSVSANSGEIITGDSFEVTVTDPNRGTVDLHYSINNGEEQVAEGLDMTGGSAVYSISVEELVCGTEHVIKLWAVDDTQQSGEELIVSFEKAHNIDLPKVAVAPTGSENGTAQHICASCGHAEDFEIMYGDVNSDGNVNSLDAALILRYDAQLASDLIPLQLMLGDTTGDSDVNSLDAAQILKLDASLITRFADALFSYDKYKELCLDHYGRYPYNDADEENSDAGNESDEFSEDSPEDSGEIGEELIGSWTGIAADGNPKTYEFYAGGVGNVKIGDVIYDVEWTVNQNEISIVKQSADIAVYSEQAVYTVLGDALVLTAEEGENCVYIKDKEGNESTDLIGAWLNRAPDGGFIRFTFDAEGKVLADYPEGSVEADWSADGENLVIDGLNVNTAYLVINDKLFVTIEDKLLMFIKDNELIGEDDDRLIGYWTNVDSDNTIKSITVEDAYVYYLHNGLIKADFYVDGKQILIDGLLYGWYKIEDSKLSILWDKQLLVFDFHEISDGSAVTVPADKENYAEGATYTLKVDGESATAALHPENTYLWGDTELNKLTDNRTVYANKLDENGAQATVSVIYLRGGKSLELVLDLGENREDIASLAFLGVRNGGDFGFDIFGTKLYTSADGENWGNAPVTSFGSQPINGAPLIGGTEDTEGSLQNYNFSYNFSSAVSGRYIKISFPATEELMQFDEILVLN